MGAIQFITVTPEQLQTEILKGVKIQFEELKKSFQPKRPEELLSRKDVAKLFKCDLSTVHNWTKKGLLVSYSMGARVYYKRTQVENAIVQLKN